MDTVLVLVAVSSDVQVQALVLVCGEKMWGRRSGVRMRILMYGLGCQSEWGQVDGSCGGTNGGLYMIIWVLPG